MPSSFLNSNLTAGAGEVTSTQYQFDAGDGGWMGEPRWTSGQTDRQTDRHAEWLILLPSLFCVFFFVC